MARKLEERVAEFIKAEGLFAPGERVLLAVSGGADSTAMLHVTARLAEEGIVGARLCCAHINHQLRGEEAERDEDFVVEQCGKLGLAATVRRIDVRGYAGEKKLSIETAARELRIGALVRIAAESDCGCIATAHQKNDNAETILHRLIRGTGFRGLCGIWPVKEFRDGMRFVRPLLCATREEIVQYLDERHLKWCTDRTNEDCAYRRNFIRHQMLPALERDCGGDIVEELALLSRAARGFYRLVCEAADGVWRSIVEQGDEQVTIDFEKFIIQPAGVRIEIICRALGLLGCGERDITEGHYKRISGLTEGKMSLPNAIEVVRRGRRIIFGRGSRSGATESAATEAVGIRVPGVTEFAGVVIEAETFEYDAARFERFKANKDGCSEWFDLDSIRPPIEARFRRRGDRFWPLGMGGEKKVGKFLTSAKVPAALRQKLLVVSDGQRIIWLWPVRICEQAKVTGGTKHILQLRIRPQSA